MMLLANAVERYIVIARGKEAKAILNTPNRKKFYTSVLVLTFLIPGALMVDYGINVEEYVSLLI